MTVRSPEAPEVSPDSREPYEAPRIDEVVEFESTALASCAKTEGFQCQVQPPGLMSS
jgi:hypothetical protein